MMAQRRRLARALPRRARQAGFTLIEVLVSMLIFGIGVLAMVGLQATSVQQSSQARFRSDASLLANDLIGQMWITDRTGATLQAQFATGGAAYTAWLTYRVQVALPGATQANTTVTVNAASGLVTVTLGWKSPNEPAANPEHRYTTVAQIQ